MATLNKVLILVARGFEEIDVSTVARALRRTGWPVAVVGLRAGAVQGAYCLSLAPDCLLSEVETEMPRVAVLAGGAQGKRRFSADPPVHRLLQRVIELRGCVLVIDTAHAVLRSASVLEPAGHQSSGEPGEEASGTPFLGWDTETRVLNSSDRPFGRVWVEGQVVFGRDSSSVQEAALTLVSLLEGEI